MKMFWNSRSYHYQHTESFAGIKTTHQHIIRETNNEYRVNHFVIQILLLPNLTIPAPVSRIPLSRSRSTIHA